MDNFILSAFERDESGIEIVERKGLGHPDTICDALAENLSRNLCREYSKRCGTILHHNVDKALLSAGRSAPSFGGGQVLAPLTICLSGRATEPGDGRTIQEIAIEGSRSWLTDNLHAFDAGKDVNFNCLIQPVSQDLRQLFTRQRIGESFPANDTSIGVGYAPLSPLEGKPFISALFTRLFFVRFASGDEDWRLICLKIGKLTAPVRRGPMAP